MDIYIMNENEWEKEIRSRYDGKLIREIRINFNCKIVKFFYNKTCFLKMLFSLSI